MAQLCFVRLSTTASKTGGVKMDTLEGIKWFSQTIWYVIFKTRVAKTDATDTQIELYGKTYKLTSAEYQYPGISYTWVRLYGFPLDTDSKYLKKNVIVWGTNCHGHRRNGRMPPNQNGCETGTIYQCSIQLNLKGNIPSFIHVCASSAGNQGTQKLTVLRKYVFSV